MRLYTRYKNGLYVSTIYLHIDHNGCWYETAILDGHGHFVEVAEQYETSVQAFAGHTRHVCMMGGRALLQAC